MRRLVLPIVPLLCTAIPLLVATYLSSAFTLPQPEGTLSGEAYALGDPRYYDIGNPGPLADLYVSPSGDDTNSGTSSSQPLRTLFEAWNRMPMTVTTTGYRINLLPGTYPCEPEEATNCLNYFSNRFGTFQLPIIIRAISGTATIRGGLNIANVRYFYLLDLTLVGGAPLPTNVSGNNLFHPENGDHVLLRGMSIVGPSCTSDGPPCNNNLQEVVKVNQTQHLYVEDSVIGGAWHSSVDYFVVQYGHFLNNRVHTAGQWCMYIKGGTAYLNIEGNELYGCQLGFQSGQSANLAVMRAPWLHYETYDIKFINNVLHDIPGVGMSVAGGDNILLAHNTLYRVGTSTINGYGLAQFVHGERNCTPTDDIPNPVLNCTAFIAQGGWGPNFQTASVEVIPNRKVYVYNNILYNPSPSETLYMHFGVDGPITPTSGFQNIPTPSNSDDYLVIRGNVIWNAPARDLPLFGSTGGPLVGCESSNPTCNPTQLRAENAVNTFEPQLVNPAQGDFRPAPSGNIASAITYAIPDFTWADAPTPPVVPAGTLTNTVNFDRGGNRRPSSSPPGAYLTSAPTSNTPTPTPTGTPSCSYLPLVTRSHSAGW